MICQKAGRQVQVLGRLSRVLSKSNKLLLYNSFIECYFTYCSVLWHFCSNVDTLKMEKLHEKALRFCTLDFASSYSQLLAVCYKSSLYTARLRKMMEMTYRILNGMYPTYLRDLIKTKETRDLRCCNRLEITRYVTVKYGKNSVSHLTPVLWNNMNNDLKNSNTFTQFKCRINAWTGPTCYCGFCVQCTILTRR